MAHKVGIGFLVLIAVSALAHPNSDGAKAQPQSEPAPAIHKSKHESSSTHRERTAVAASDAPASGDTDLMKRMGFKSSEIKAAQADASKAKAVVAAVPKENPHSAPMTDHEYFQAVIQPQIERAADKYRQERQEQIINALGQLKVGMDEAKAARP